jgi:hypothetical protein
LKYLIFSFLLSSSLFAKGINLKPGLWEMEVKLIQNGQELDPLESVRAMLKNMTGEQKQAMIRMMESQGLDLSLLDKKTCFTPEILAKDPSALLAQSKNCKMKIQTQNKNKYVASGKCSDDRQVEIDVSLRNKTSFSSVVKTSKTDGTEKRDMKISGKFLKSECGKIKPSRI